MKNKYNKNSQEFYLAQFKSESELKQIADWKKTKVVVKGEKKLKELPTPNWTNR